jgi:hypothetical protein
MRAAMRTWVFKSQWFLFTLWSVEDPPIPSYGIFNAAEQNEV